MLLAHTILSMLLAQSSSVVTFNDVNNKPFEFKSN